PQPAVQTAVTAATPAATTPVAITRTGIDLNTASEAEITKLVGKALTKRVMAFRPYTSVQDLIKAGVSQKTTARRKPAAYAAPSKSGTKGAGSCWWMTARTPSAWVSGSSAKRGTK